MELIGERWSLIIVRELMFGPRRISDLRGSLPGISAKGKWRSKGLAGGKHWIRDTIRCCPHRQYR